MSKRAEEAANKDFEGRFDTDDQTVIWFMDKMKHSYIRAYEQAEKDLALTWEDMAKIDAIILDVNNEFAVDHSKEIDRQKFYEEVLKRFKEAKK